MNVRPMVGRLEVNESPDPKPHLSEQNNLPFPMKKRFCTLFAALSFFTGVVSLALPVSANAATNLLPNGGFELGNTTGWMVWGSTLAANAGAARTGNFGGLVTGRSFDWQTAVINALPLVQPGKTYQFSVWVRLGTPGATSPVSVIVAQTDANPRGFLGIATGTANATGWTELRGEFTYLPTGTASELSIYLQCADTTSPLHIDDASLVLSDNTWLNNGFERGTNEGWTPVGCSLAASSTDKRSGQFSGYVTGRTLEWHAAWKDLLPLVTSGKSYRITTWVKPDDGLDVTIQLLVKQTDGGVDTYTFLQQVVCPAGRWTELSGGFKFTNPGNTTGLSVYLYCLDPTRNYRIDDAELRPDELSVDLAVTGAPVTQKATGFLHGLGAAVPSTSHYEALKPRIQRFPAFLANPNILGSPTGFGSAAYMNRLKNVGAKQQVLISDEYMWFGYHTSWGWPGDAAHDGKTPYQILDERINALLDYALVNFPAADGWQIEWDIWNEPDNADFWGRSQAQFFETWKHAFETIRAKDPNAKIVGPSIAYFVTKGANPTQAGWLKPFLIYARDNNVLPDVVSWHEMVNPNEIPAQVQLVREFMAANGIANRPISVNEYQGPGDNLMLSPGNTVSFLSNLESTDVINAIRACWNEDAAQTDGTTNGLFPGRLDNIMTMSPFQPRALWHVYRSYADFSGLMTPVTRGGFQRGLASVDAAAGKARVLVGNDGTQTFATNLTVRNLSHLADYALTGKVRVKVREIPFSGLNPLGAPTELSNAVLTPGGDELVVPLTVNPRAAYEITLETAAPKVLSITPVPGAGGSSQAQYRVLFDRAVAGFDSAEDVTISGSGASAAFGNIAAESPSSYLVTLVNVTGAGSLTLTVAGTSVTSVPAAQSILVDNFSFENALGGGGMQNANWATGNWAIYAPAPSSLVPTNGTQVGYTNSAGGTLTQVLDAYKLGVGDQITVRVDFGWPAPTAWGGGSVTVSSVNGPNGSVAMGTFPATQPPANGWNTLTIPLTVNAPQSGGFLQLVISRGAGGAQTVVDNVRADVVPAAAGLPGVISAPSPSLFTLETNAGANGLVTRSPNAAAYPGGTFVTLTAEPHPGYQFGAWSGAITGSTNPSGLTVNGPVTVGATFTLNPAVYEGWSIQHFGSVQSEGADPDGDGISNLAEYAMALEPQSADATLLPRPTLAPDGRLQMVYRRNLVATDLVYSPQGKFDLGAAWVDLVNPPTEDLGTVGNLQMLRVTDTEVSWERRFLRLNIQRTAP